MDEEERLDILHPLATLQFKHCHTWRRDVRPVNCAALHDTVAILQHSEDGDIINITTSDISSWTISKLPYYYTSLAVYKSRFTAVGGRHPNTGIVTNELLNSENGLKWTSSLPPLPTKRYFMASVGSSESDVLVVAGGLSSDHYILDIVEILVEDQWYIADPLPKPCCRIWPAFHQGSFYFTEGVGWEVTIFHCSISSLLSSKESSHAVRSTGSIWNSIEGTADSGAITSFGEHLITIDEEGTAFGYCSNSKTWVKVSIGGDYVKNYTRVVCFMYVATTVLSSGDLLLCTNLGVYCGKLLVSTFSTENKFPSDVIMKLEAVMGIGIPSALAEVSAELKVASGVQLKAEDEYENHLVLPNPDESPDLYVHALISQWSKGDSSWRSPKWRELFDVLRNIEKVQIISLQIEAFMKGERYIKAYRHYVTCQMSLDIPFFKFLFLGLPGSGKTTLLHKLLDETIDLNTSGIADNFLGVVVSEAQYVYQTKVHAGKSCSGEEFTGSHCEHEADKEISERWESSRTMSENKLVPIQMKGLNQHLIIKSLLSTLPHRQQISIFHQDTSDVTSTTIFPCLDDVKQMFSTCLRVQDVGGQPELIDILPALTVGSGLYFLFVNDHHYFCESDFSTPSVEPRYNTEEVLLSSLFCISCSDAVSKMCSFTLSSKPTVFIVGTHKDKVSKDQIECMNKNFQRVVKSMGVDNVLKDKLLVTLHNIRGGTNKLKKIQTLLEKKKGQHFKKLRIPAKWILFGWILKRLNKNTVTLEECTQASGQLGMTCSEMSVALWFLHHHAGVMMYFPNHPELKDLVIVDIQVVYNSVSSLIVRAMKSIGDDFRKTGKFYLHQIAVTDIPCDWIPVHKLLSLLEYLYIVAQISAPQQNVLQYSKINKGNMYFMPCVLNSATEDELDYLSKKQSEISPVSPLMIHFKCGFVPIGIFSSMVACLCKSESFALIEDGLKKNVAKFCYGPNSSLLTLICHYKYFEIIISELTSGEVEPHLECSAVKSEIEYTFSRIGSRLNYDYFMRYQFAFECPIHPGNNRDHLCVVGDAQDIPTMLCLNADKKTKPIDFNAMHKVWFYRKKSTAQETSDPTHAEKTSTALLHSDPASLLEALSSTQAPKRKSWIPWKIVWHPLWIIAPLAVLLLSVFFHYIIYFFVQKYYKTGSRFPSSKFDHQ